MGITKDTIKYLDLSLSFIGKNEWSGTRILELGNQCIYPETGFKTGKQYFESLGAIHVSIDLNGRDGALALDLSKPISGIGEPFDVSTNYGTIEHVENNNDMAFANMIILTRVGGVMVHALPKIGHWKGHGKYHYSESFVNELAEKHGLEILLLEELKRDKNKNLIMAILRKTK